MDESPAHRQTPPAAPTPPPKHVVASPVPLTTKQRPATPVRGDSLLSLSAMPGAFPRAPGQQPHHHLASSAEPDDRANFPASPDRAQSPVRLLSEDLRPLQREAELSGQQKDLVREKSAIETASPDAAKPQQSAQSLPAPHISLEPVATDAMPPAIPLDLSDRRRTALPIPAVTARAQPSSISPVFTPGIAAPVRIESHFGPAEKKTETVPHAEHARTDHVSEKSSKKNSLGARFDALLHGIKRPSKPAEPRAADEGQAARGSSFFNRFNDGHRPVPQPFSLNPAELEARMNALIEEERIAGGSESSSINDASSRAAASRASRTPDPDQTPALATAPDRQGTEHAQSVPDQGARESHSPAVVIGAPPADGEFAPLPSKLDREFRKLAAGESSRHEAVNEHLKIAPTASEHEKPAVAIGLSAGDQEFARLPAHLGREFDALTSKKPLSSDLRRASHDATSEHPSAVPKSSGDKKTLVAIGSSSHDQEFAPLPADLSQKFDALTSQKPVSGGAERGRASMASDSSRRSKSSGRRTPTIAIGSRKEGQQFSPLPPKLESRFDALVHRKSMGSDENVLPSVSEKVSKPAAVSDKKDKQQYAVPEKLASAFDDVLHRRKSLTSEKNRSASTVSSGHPKGASSASIAIGEEGQSGQHFAPISPKLESRFDALKAKISPSHKGIETDTNAVAHNSGHSKGTDKPQHSSLKSLREDEAKYELNPVSPVTDRSGHPLQGADTSEAAGEVADDDIYSCYLDVPAAEPRVKLAPEALKAGEHEKPLRDPHEEHSYTAAHGRIEPVSVSSSRSVSPTYKKTGPPRASSPPTDRKALESKFEDLLSRVSHPTQQISPYPAGSAGRSASDVGHNVDSSEPEDEVPFLESEATLQEEYLKLMQQSSTSDNRSSPSFREATTPPHADAETVSTLKPRKSFSFGRLTKRDSSRNVSPRESPGRSDAPSPDVSVEPVPRRGSAPTTARPSSTLETRFDSLLKRLRRASTAESLKEAPTYKSRPSSDVRQERHDSLAQNASTASSAGPEISAANGKPAAPADAEAIPMVAPPVARAEMPAHRDPVKSVAAAETALKEKSTADSARRRSAGSASREPARAFDLQQSFDNLLRRTQKPAPSESGHSAPKSSKWLRKSFDSSSYSRPTESATAASRPRQSSSAPRTPTHISSSGQAIYDEEYRSRQSMDAGSAEGPAAAQDDEEARRAYPMVAPAPKKTPLMRAKKSLTELMSIFKAGNKTTENSSATAAESRSRPSDGASNAPTTIDNAARQPIAPAAQPKRSASLDQPDTEGSQNDDSDLYVPDPSPLPAAYDVNEDDDTEEEARTFHQLPPTEAIQFDPNSYGMDPNSFGRVSRSHSPDGEQEIRIEMEQSRRW
ncbi:hypothetical protein HDU86_006059 [Geranomyces michiganensis]|nr:hypothetical protein HDU86_006059 [Geranomyces michiganensis]